MERQEILNSIIKDLEALVTQKPRDFYYHIDFYADSYYEDNTSALMLKWNQLDYGDFDKIFPITTKLVAELKSMNDGVERPREVYESIISLAKDALKEVKEYKVS